MKKEKKDLRQCINAYGKQKKSFDTLDLAIAWAKKVNTFPTTIHKQVAYKCKVCHKYHTGRNKYKILHHQKDIYTKPF